MGFKFHIKSNLSLVLARLVTNIDDTGLNCQTRVWEVHNHRFSHYANLNSNKRHFALCDTSLIKAVVSDGIVKGVGWAYIIFAHHSV